MLWFVASCEVPQVLRPTEYDVIDTIRSYENGFGTPLGYDFLIRKHEDSLLRMAYFSISANGMTYVNPRALKIKK